MCWGVGVIGNELRQSKEEERKATQEKERAKEEQLVVKEKRFQAWLVAWG